MASSPHHLDLPAMVDFNPEALTPWRIVGPCFTTETGKEMEAEMGTKKWDSWCNKPDHVSFRPLEVFCGKNVGELELWAREVI